MRLLDFFVGTLHRLVLEQEVAVAAHVEQDHLVKGALALVLEHDSLLVTAAGAGKVVRPAQRRIRHQLVNHTRLLLGDILEIVPKHQGRGRLGAVGAIAAGVHQDVIRPIRLGIQQIVALGAKVQRRHRVVAILGARPVSVPLLDPTRHGKENGQSAILRAPSAACDEKSHVRLRRGIVAT